MTNSTSNEVTFGGAWCNRMIAKQHGSYFIRSTDKVIEENIQPIAPLITIIALTCFMYISNMNGLM